MIMIMIMIMIIVIIIIINNTNNNNNNQLVVNLFIVQSCDLRSAKVLLFLFVFHSNKLIIKSNAVKSGEDIGSADSHVNSFGFRKNIKWIQRARYCSLLAKIRTKEVLQHGGSVILHGTFQQISQLWDVAHTLNLEKFLLYLSSIISQFLDVIH